MKKLFCLLSSLFFINTAFADNRCNRLKNLNFSYDKCTGIGDFLIIEKPVYFQDGVYLPIAPEPAIQFIHGSDYLFYSRYLCDSFEFVHGPVGRGEATLLDHEVRAVKLIRGVPYGKIETSLHSSNYIVHSLVCRAS